MLSTLGGVVRGTLLEGARWCLRACREGRLKMVELCETNDLVLKISPERLDGAAIAILSVPNDEDLLRLVRLTLMEDYARKGTVREDVEGGKVHIHFLIPVQRAE